LILSLVFLLDLDFLSLFSNLEAFQLAFHLQNIFPVDTMYSYDDYLYLFHKDCYKDIWNDPKTNLYKDKNVYMIESHFFCFCISFKKYFTWRTYNNTTIWIKSRSSTYFALSWRFVWLLFDNSWFNYLIQIFSSKYIFHPNSFSLVKP
jgi:hypothetical protein